MEGLASPTRCQLQHSRVDTNQGDIEYCHVTLCHARREVRLAFISLTLRPLTLEVVEAVEDLMAASYLGSFPCQILATGAMGPGAPPVTRHETV